MDKRLIDANELTESLRESIENLRECCGGSHRGYYKQICSGKIGTLHETIVRIRELPTVDAVEVVRCEECGYYDTEGEYCSFWGGCRHPEHYCGEGEK